MGRDMFLLQVCCFRELFLAWFLLGGGSLVLSLHARSICKAHVKGVVHRFLFYYVEQ